jgi:formylglycine-generating enzyme required for sulfatase activity
MERTGKIARWLSVTLGIVLLTSFTVDATLQGGALSQSALGILATGATGTKGCPEGMTALGGALKSVCVDLYEASPGEACEHHEVKNAGQTRSNIERSGCVPESKSDALPWTFVNLSQAQELCARAGKRLLSNEEWYRAALGTTDSPGSDACNIRSSAPEPTGAHAQCASALLAHDMIGNVWEWVDGEIADLRYEDRVLPHSGYVTEADQGGVVVKTDSAPSADYYADYFWSESEGVYGMLRGGFYASGDDAGTFTIQGKTPPSFQGAAVGFRCGLDLPS